MRMTLSVSCQMWLLSLTVVMLVSGTGADGFLEIGCCTQVSKTMIKKVDECYNLRGVCSLDAFMIKNRRGVFCIDPEADWLKTKIAEGLECRSLVSQPIFEVLDEDDMK